MDYIIVFIVLGIFIIIWNHYHSQLELVGSGSFTEVYKINSDKVYKKIRSSTKPCQKELILRSWKRVKDNLNDIKYFPTIYNINEKDFSSIQEYVPYPIEERHPENYEKQIKDLSKILNGKKYNITDIQPKNVRVTKDGIVKIIDCEVYSTEEYNTKTPVDTSGPMLTDFCDK